MNLWNWLDGWRKHTSPYVEEAAKRRGVKVRTYRKGMLLMLEHRTRQVVFHAVPCNIWGDMPDMTVDYTTYIQEKVDEVTGYRWTFKYDGTD